MLHVDSVGDEEVCHSNGASGGRYGEGGFGSEGFEEGEGDEGSGSTEDGSAVDFLAHLVGSPLIVGSFSEGITENDLGDEPL